MNKLNRMCRKIVYGIALDTYDEEYIVYGDMHRRLQYELFNYIYTLYMYFLREMCREKRIDTFCNCMQFC